MNHPNDMPADTELRKAINNIMFNKMGNQGWNGSTTALVYIEAIDDIMQLIKQREIAKEREIHDSIHRIYQRQMEYLKKERDMWRKATELHICPTVIQMPEGFKLSTPTDQKEKE